MGAETEDALARLARRQTEVIRAKNIIVREVVDLHPGGHVKCDMCKLVILYKKEMNRANGL